MIRVRVSRVMIKNTCVRVSLVLTGRDWWGKAWWRSDIDVREVSVQRVLSVFRNILVERPGNVVRRSGQGESGT